MWEGLPELWAEPLVSCHGFFGRDYILGQDQTPCREGFFFLHPSVGIEESQEVGMENCVGVSARGITRDVPT